MQTRAQFLDDILTRLNSIKSEVEKQFYYLESEDLIYKPSEKKWNIIEVFEHINLVNHFYLKRFERVLENVEDTSDMSFKQGWMGRQMEKSMKPKDNKISFRMKTFKVSDPIQLQKKGKKLVDHVVFQDFMQGLDRFIKVVEDSKNKPIQKIKIRSLVSFLKFKMGDAMGFILAHTERHLLQAQQLLPQNRG